MENKHVFMIQHTCSLVSYYSYKYLILNKIQVTDQQENTLFTRTQRVFCLICEIFCISMLSEKLMLVAMWSKAEVCDRLIAGITGLNPAEGMDVRLLCLLCVLWVVASVMTYHTFTGVLQFVCVCVCVCLIWCNL
jgi:hypothetical protein